MNCIELAFRRADAAADALVVVHHGSAAAQTARGFDGNLFFGQRLAQITEGEMDENFSKE